MRTGKPLLIALPSLALAAAVCVSLAGTVAIAGGKGEVDLRAEMDGKATGGAGRGATSLSLDPSRRKLCYEIETDGAEKGRAFIGRGAKGDRGSPVLTLFSRSVEGRGLRGCVDDVSRDLLEDMAAEPSDYFAALTSREFPDGAIRGQLRRFNPRPGAGSGYSATDCYIYLDDDTGEGHDFATGQSTTPTPINGGGVRYLATEDHSVTTCIAERTYTFPQGTIKVYAKDRLIGSNVYSCTATGIYKCFGPREGSTTSGYTLSVIYYVCIPGAWPPAYYCPR
jgi:hypothetical protein